MLNWFPSWLRVFIRVLYPAAVGSVVLLLAISAHALTRANQASMVGITGAHGSLAFVVDQSGYIVDYRRSAASLPWDTASQTYEVDPIIDTMELMTSASLADETPGGWVRRSLGVGVYYLPDVTHTMMALTFRHWVVLVCACTLAGAGLVWRRRRRSTADVARRR